MTTAPDDLATIREHLKRGIAFIDDHAEEYAERRDYYTGERAEVSASVTVRRLIQASAQAHPISLAHIPVDALVDIVQLSSLGAKDARADAFLTKIWDDEDLEDEVDDWHRKACYFGDYYVIVDIPLESGDGTALAVKPTGSSPLTTAVIYDPRDERTILYGVKRWKVGKTWAANVFYDDMTVKLISSTGATSAPNSDDFDYDVDDTLDPESARIPHLGGEPLIVHYAIDGKPYGTPVHKKAFGPQDAITKISATNLSNVDGQGFASRWALSDPMAEIDDDIDDDFGDDGPTTVTGTGDSQSGVTAGTSSRVRTIPGAIALLKGIRSVGQFNATDTDNFLKNLDWYVRVMAVATGVPLFEFDLTGDQPSGEARRRAKERLTNHARKVIRALGNAHKTLADTMLAVAGMQAVVAPAFRPTETSSDKEGFELIAQKIKTGVPIQQAFTEAGYTDDQVSEWFPNGEPNINYDTLVQLASSLSSLGTAKTLGVVTDQELHDLLPTVLTSAVGEGPTVDPALPANPSDAIVVDAGKQLSDKTNALGQLIRSGADPEDAARFVGLEGISFPNISVSVRTPKAQEVVDSGGAGA